MSKTRIERGREKHRKVSCDGSASEGLSMIVHDEGLMKEAGKSDRKSLMEEV